MLEAERDHDAEHERVRAADDTARLRDRRAAGVRCPATPVGRREACERCVAASGIDRRAGVFDGHDPGARSCSTRAVVAWAHAPTATSPQLSVPCRRLAGTGPRLRFLAMRDTILLVSTAGTGYAYVTYQEQAHDLGQGRAHEVRPDRPGARALRREEDLEELISCSGRTTAHTADARRASRR